ncbi:MAG: hypothetical protein WBQ85_12530, partial [Candidatus Sulfotelmatobacter sp.]
MSTKPKLIHPNSASPGIPAGSSGLPAGNLRSGPADSQRVYNLESGTPSMTDQLRKKLQEEVDALEHELVHELPKEIKRAAALGDLSENAEYHMAKQRQEFVKA